MRHSYALAGSAITAALVLGACSSDPVGPSTSATSVLSHHVTKICDFVTFGRLVANGVVISGNAGGNQPGGGIKGEIEIHIGDETIHAHTITEYGRPLDGVFGGVTNARAIRAVGDGGENINLRLVDNGEPGKNVDQVYLVINGTVILGPQTIDKGNVQLHLRCRGPKD